MSYKHFKNLTEPIDGVKKLMGVAWSEEKIAVATTEDNKKLRIWLYDKQFIKQDSFPAKSSIKNYYSYLVTRVLFNKDASKLVVAQTDNVTFIYSIGKGFGEKKTICNKFELTSGAVDIAWFNREESEVAIATQEGKVKLGSLKTNSCTLLFNAEVFLVSFALNREHKVIFTGHEDNSIFKYDMKTKTHQKFLSAETIPYCVEITDFLMIAGEDEKIYLYNHQNKELDDVVDLTGNKLADFSCSTVVPQARLVIFGNYNSVVVLRSTGKKYVLSQLAAIENYYTVTSVAASPTGSFLFLGSLNGSTDILELEYKKMLFKGRFEVTIYSETAIRLTDTKTNKFVEFQSEHDILADCLSSYKETYFLVPTQKTFFFVNLEKESFTELQMQLCGKEDFIFREDTVTVVFDEEFRVFTMEEGLVRKGSANTGDYILQGERIVFTNKD